MTIETISFRNDYVGNGSQTVFAFTFKVLYEVAESPAYSIQVITTDLLGTETVKTQITDYTVTLNTDGTGIVTFATAPITGYKVTLLRAMSKTQRADYINAGTDKFPGNVHELALDKLTLIVQEYLERFNRIVTLPKNSLLSNIELPINTTRADQVLAINSAGDNLTTKNLADVGLAPVTNFIKTLLDDIDAATARNTLSAQAQSINLSALAGLTGAAEKIPYFTGAGAMALADKGYQLKSIQTFTSSGTWTKPDGIKAVIVEVQGAGGSGAGASGTANGGGGGAGGYSKKFITSGLGATETVTVGIGGAAVGGSTSGNGGSSSSFGSHCSATGGGGGGYGGSNGGDGGIGSGGNFNLKGNPGHGHVFNGLGTGDIGSNGGSSVFGGAGIGGRNFPATGGTAYANSGSGGGSGYNGGGSGAGANGIVIVYEYV